MSALLPQGFEDLDPFVERWAIEGTANRAALRGEAGKDERAAFYAAVAPRAAEALDYLDGLVWGGYSQDEQRLMAMLLAFAHISIAEEIQREDEAAHAAARCHMMITRSPADLPA